MNDFSDIIQLPHHVSRTRRHMSFAERAAQFSAFAALTGFDEKINATAQRTVFGAETPQSAEFLRIQAEKRHI